MRQTSLDAYHRLKESGALQGIQGQVYEALFAHGPMTRNELDARLRGPNAVNASYSRRLTELEDKGLAARFGVKKCALTGRSCDAWDVTDIEEPCAVKRGPTWKKKAEAYRKAMITFAGWLDRNGQAKAAESVRSKVEAIEGGDLD